MTILPFPCTSKQELQSPDNPQKTHSHLDFSESESESISLSSQPSLPSVISLTSQPPSTAAAAATHHLLATLKPHTSCIYSLALAGKHLLSTSSDGRIRTSPRNPNNPHPHNTTAYASSAVKSMVVVGDRLFTGHHDHKIRVWRINPDVGIGEKTVSCVATLPTVSDRLEKMLFAKNYVKVRRHKTSTWVHHVDAVTALAAAHDGSAVYSGSWDRSFKVWRTSDFRCVESVHHAHDDAVSAVAVAPDGDVYTGSADRKIKVWRRHGGDKKHSLIDTLEKHKSAVNALALSGDGCVLYSGACDRSIIVWEKGGGGGGWQRMAVAGALRGHTKAVLCIAVVGEVVVSGSADKTVRVWRRGINGNGYFRLGVLEGHNGPVKCLAAAVDGCTSGSSGGTSYLVYSGGLDCDVKVWKVWVPLF